MFTTESLIPAELTIAPNPSRLTPSLKLTTIPVAAHTCFELWMPKPQAILSREEALLLVTDRPRLEEICAKLTWLLGSTFVQHETPLQHPVIYDWETVLERIRLTGANYDALGFTYLPQTIYPNFTQAGISTSWTLSPISWSVLFLDLKTAASGYVARPRAMSLLLTCGQPMTKSVQKMALRRS